MKVHVLAIVLIIGMAAAIPVASAQIIEEKDGYIVATEDNSRHLVEVSRISASSITQGQTQWYSTSVSSGKTAFYADLSWGQPSSSLALTISPPGTSLGPYYDGADGVVDGRINIRVTSGGSLTPGTWWSKVYGYSVSGSQSYTYSASAA